MKWKMKIYMNCLDPSINAIHLFPHTYKKGYGSYRSQIHTYGRVKDIITWEAAVMRMKELKIETGQLNLDIMELPESCVIIISKGIAKIAELPRYAETRIITHQGQVKRVKWDEGEEF